MELGKKAQYIIMMSAAVVICSLVAAIGSFVEIGFVENPTAYTAVQLYNNLWDGFFFVGILAIVSLFVALFIIWEAVELKRDLKEQRPPAT